MSVIKAILILPVTEKLILMSVTASILILTVTEK